MPFLHVRPVEPDLLLNDEDFSLERFGVGGRIIATPGHTRGSVSVVLDSGDAFVGDMAMNGWPLCRRPSLSIFAEDVAQVRESWQRLIDRGARCIHPAHGRPFPVEALDL